MKRFSGLYAALACMLCLAQPSSAQESTAVIEASSITNSECRHSPVGCSFSLLQEQDGLCFSPCADTVPGNTSGHVAHIGLTCNVSNPGVQGIQFTVRTVGHDLRIRRIEMGSEIPTPERWIIDYQIFTTAGGSELRFIAFGRDTATNIGAGHYDDLFRIVYDVPAVGLGRHGADGGNLHASMELADVGSAMADRYGRSAGIGILPDRGAFDLTIHGKRPHDFVDAPIVWDAGNGSIAMPLESWATTSDVEAASEAAVLPAVAPNPSAGATTVRFGLDHPASVTMAIVDVVGREVARPLDGAAMGPGEHSVRIEAGQLRSGTYLCILTTNGVRGGSGFLVLR